MATKQSTDADRRKAAQYAKIKTRGLEDAEYPYKIIADELRDRITKGIFKPGERVPSITELMTMADAAKNTCRAGLDILREQGFIKTLAGLGTTVRPEKYWNTTPAEREALEHDARTAR